MTTQNSKTIISYSGGCAGDMFTMSCNGEILYELDKHRVVQPATLKDYEHKVRLGIDVDLETELQNIPYKFVNTHLLDEVVGKGSEVYNVVIISKDVQLKTVYRQMKIQKLRIQIDTRPTSWYNTISEYCLNKNYTDAAVFWYNNAERLWLDRMNYRLEYTKAKKIDFSKLYDSEFIDDLVRQGWAYSTSLLKYNHDKWLEKNTNFNYEDTITAMAHKLSMMNWEQKEGWVEYNPS